MIRRALSTTAATAAIILAPTAALAYPDDPYEVDVPGSVAQGVPFDINLEGPNENALFGLTIASANVPNSAIEIAGSQTMEKPTVGGAATFSVTLNEEAVYTITAVDQNGDVVEESTVTVGDPATSAGAGSDNSEDAAALPDTGATSTPLVVGAAALLAAGAGVLVFARRQTQA
ncbi:LPXTG cell wall anchor domain-containing protein [Georgenia daeguensis]|uniref:Gram-positive cocci surface proteins LPxTG domain-containing protein n=1 Tax=Georgenia daeguensis TaxID=908355 RepID=A0ABP8ESH8_9MICO